MANATMMKARTDGDTARHRHFEVDLWATSINDIEIGVMRQTQHRAKSSQFTKDMDVIGQVTAGGERIGVLAYRAGLWNERTGARRRLVIKLFTASMNWRATLDMLVGRSLQLTHGADGTPVVAYAINSARSDKIVQLERSADQWALFPEKYSFAIHDENATRYFKLRQCLFSVGSDYEIIDQNEKKIGFVDGKLLSVGGYWKVKVLAEDNDPQLDATLQLFCAMLRFNKTARGHISSVFGDMSRGEMSELDLDGHERELYANPRRAR